MNNETMQVIFGLAGGLAIFIFGMNFMSEGLQKIAGERMRNVLALLTKNPFVGVLSGAVVTMMIQSSSATTVMVIGFVSAGLMNLPQAISIILGANIGTTVTAQLIAFKIGAYAWPILAIGFVFYFFSKNLNLRYLGQTVFAFGLLFVGINTMGDVMKPLASSEFFTQLVLDVKNWPVIGVFVGTAMTVVVQSSSATIAVLQNLASQAGPDGVHSAMGISASLPILYGFNIGTTITALLASIGASVNAKRTAIAHSVFNISGAILFMFIIPPFVKFVEFISPKGIEIDIISRQIANAHTSFNIVNTLIWLPFIWLLVKIVCFLIKDKPGEIEDKSKPRFLDEKVLHQPVFAMHMATRELSRIAELTIKMIGTAKIAVVADDIDKANKVLEYEDRVDKLQDATVKYLSSIFSTAELTPHQGNRIAGLMHIASDIERIGDYCTNIAEFAIHKIENKFEFSEDAISEIGEGFDHVLKMAQNTMSALQNGDVEIAKLVLEQEAEINDLEDRLRVHHMKRINSGKCSPEFTVLFTDIVHNIERIGDHCNNIAEAVIADIDFRGIESE